MIAIQGATVIPVTGAPPIPDATVVIRGDRIADVGPASQTDVPQGARIVDGRGRFVVPGFVEMHAHLSKTRASAMGLFVANGVTTVRDTGGDHEELLQWRREVNAGRRIGPRMLIAGPYLESASNIARMRKDPPEERVEPFERIRIPIGNPDEAARVVRMLAAKELDFLKIRTVQDRATYLAINRAADAHGLKVVGHVPPTFGPRNSSRRARTPSTTVSIPDPTRRRARSGSASGGASRRRVCRSSQPWWSFRRR